MRFFRDLLLAGLATAAVILALEGGLRLARAHYEASLYEPESERGYALRPNAEGWSVEEAEVYLRINSDGMRDRERPIVRPPHTLRVAVIGSSEADARQVPLDKTFEAVMNRDLSRELEPGGGHADVLGFGAPGYTLSQEYLTLHNHVWKYEPQVVILLFSAFTVLKNTREFYPGELKGAPVYVLQSGGQLVPDAITRNTPLIDARRLLWKNRMSDWMNRSYLLCLLNAARIQSRGLMLMEKLRGRPPKVSPAPGVDPGWSYNPGQPEIEECWAIADAFVDAMKKDCGLHGAEFRIVTSDFAAQVHPSLEKRAAFQRSMGLSSLDLVDQRLERFGATRGIPVLALAGPLGAYAASHGVFLHGAPPSRDNGGHWNELGNEQAGHVIARELLARSPVVRAFIQVSAVRAPRSSTPIPR